MSPWRLTPSVRHSCYHTRSTPSLKPFNRPPWRESVYVLARPERFRVGHYYFFFFLAAFLVFFLRVFFFAAFFFVDFFAAFLRLFFAIRSPPFLNKIVHHELTLSKNFFSQLRCAKSSAHFSALFADHCVPHKHIGANILRRENASAPLDVFRRSMRRETMRSIGVMRATKAPVAAMFTPSSAALHARGRT